VADPLNLTTLGVVLIVFAILLFLTHILSFIIFIYWNLSQYRITHSPGCCHQQWRTQPAARAALGPPFPLSGNLAAARPRS